MHISDRRGFSLMKRSWRRSAGTTEDGQRERGTRSRNGQRQRTRARRSAERGTHEARTDTRRRRLDLSREGQRESKDRQRNGTPNTPRGINCTRAHETATAEAVTRAETERRTRSQPERTTEAKARHCRPCARHSSGDHDQRREEREPMREGKRKEGASEKRHQSAAFSQPSRHAAETRHAANLASQRQRQPDRTGTPWNQFRFCGVCGIALINGSIYTIQDTESLHL